VFDLTDSGLDEFGRAHRMVEFVPTGSMMKEAGWPASKKLESVSQYSMAGSVPRAEPGPTR
jgi:hypothetical protein